VAWLPFYLFDSDVSLLTERHWKALRRWAGRVGVKIPRTGPPDGPGKEIFAFPAALAAIQSGQGRANNP
jgi:hypothetical protein